MKPRALVATIAVVALLLAGVVTRGDIIDQQFSLFGGRNIYSPTVILDGTTYRMWYGGWQEQSDYPNDRIYTRSSADNVGYAPHVTVLSPWQVHPDAIHVNDPTVTKEGGTYTMFYTVCLTTTDPGCVLPESQQIWSSVSSDGVSWTGHQVLLAGPPGPEAPSAVLDPEPDGTHWKVYYIDRADNSYVKMARVDSNRHAFSVQNVYSRPGLILANAQVAFFGSQWHLFFNVYPSVGSGADMHRVTSATSTSWPPISAPIMQGFCTLAPGVLGVLGGLPGEYDLYFAHQAPSGGCNFSNWATIERWRMRIS